jgi:hypothetical protein
LVIKGFTSLQADPFFKGIDPFLVAALAAVFT